MEDVTDDVLAAVGVTREEFEKVEGDSPSDLDISLTSQIDQAIQDHIEEDDGESDRHKLRIGTYHASSGTKCIRKRWYSAKGVAKAEWHEFPAGIAHRGNVTEDEVEEAMANNLADVMREEISGAIRIGNEYPVAQEITDYPEIGDFYLTGSTDPYVEDVNGCLIEIVEVKSTRNIPDEPHWYHKMQLNCYLSILGVQRGTVVYVNPSDWEDRECLVYEQDDGLWEITKILHAVFHYHLKNDTLPPRTPMKEDECEYCAYKGYCKRNSRADEFTAENFPPDWDEDRYNYFDENSD